MDNRFKNDGSFFQAFQSTSQQYGGSQSQSQSPQQRRQYDDGRRQQYHDGGGGRRPQLHQSQSINDAAAYPQYSVQTPTAGDFLKARLVQSQQVEQQKQKELNEQRKLEKQIELERQKQRILEQTRKMKEQSAKKKKNKRHVKPKPQLDRSKLFSLDDEEDENENEEASQTDSSKAKPSAQQEKAVPAQQSLLNNRSSVPFEGTGSASQPQQPTGTATATVTKGGGGGEVKKSKWDQTDVQNRPTAQQIAQLLHAQEIANKLSSTAPQQFDENGELIPPAPKDPEVIKNIDRLVDFVSRYGIEFENVVRTRNKNVDSFKFLFDMLSPDYSFYKWKLREKQKREEAETIASMVRKARGDAPPPPTDPSAYPPPWESAPSQVQPPMVQQQQPQQQYPSQQPQQPPPVPVTSRKRKSKWDQQEQPPAVTQQQQPPATKAKVSRSKWDQVEVPAQLATTASVDNSSNFDRLDEQEMAKSVSAAPPPTYNAAPPPSYNAAPPPQRLGFGGTTVGARPVNRDNQFSVKGIHKEGSDPDVIGGTGEGGTGGDTGGGDTGGEKRKRKRKFSETPTGDVKTRTELDSVAQMNWFVKNADQTEQRDYIPPVEDDEELAPKKKTKGHHIGDFLPADEAAKFEAQSSGSKWEDKKHKLENTNVGHKMLLKMGWKEGEGIGAQGNKGRDDPIGTHSQKWRNQGVGAGREGEANPHDDIYTTYKKRMMLAYRFRPNPLNNPRKPYY